MKKIIAFSLVFVFVMILFASLFAFPVLAAESHVYNGIRALEFKVAGVCLAYHTATLEVGKTYTFSAWVMHPETGARVSMNSLRWIGAWGGSESHDALFTYTEHNSEGGHTYGDNALITDGTWQKAWYTFTIPEKSGDPTVGDHVTPGTSSYYSLSIDIRGKGTIYIDEVWLIDRDNPTVNLIEDGGFENAVVGPNDYYFGGADWRGANLVKVGSKYWWPQYGYEVDGSGSISPFAIVSVDTAVVAPEDPDHPGATNPVATENTENSPIESSEPEKLPDSSNSSNSSDVPDISNISDDSSISDPDAPDLLLPIILIVVIILLVAGIVLFIIHRRKQSKI